MTEYTTSSQAIRDYLSSKERTKRWVIDRLPAPEDCYSPSVPPSILTPDFVLPPVSDAGSSHSLPPKMVLRYNDGRPDEAIPHDRHGSKLRPHETQRSQTMPTPHPRSRSGSHTAPRVPEEIRVLPSHAEAPPRSAHSHARSKSLPRNAYSQIQDPMPEMPMPHPSQYPSHPSQYNLPAPGGPIRPLPNRPLVTFSQPPQPWHAPAPPPDGFHGRQHVPPAIVYAPSHRSRPHYAPPAIFTHPPKMGPNGMIYSHSDPVRPSQYSQYPQKYPTPYPSVVPSSAHSHMSSVKEERRSKTPNGRHRSRSRNGSHTARQLSPASSVSSFVSNGSGSTYYVMPTGRQKVHVIHTPDTSASLHSHSQHSQHSHSPTSVRSGSGGGTKRPFFQRLLGYAEKRLFNGATAGDSSQSSGSSSRGGRRLHRRHSTGTGSSGRSRSVPPGE